MKSSQLQSEGYYADLSNHMGPVATNNGFIERNTLFRKGGKADQEYKSDGVKFIGRLQLDLISCPSGLPPGTKVDIEVAKVIAIY